MDIDGEAAASKQTLEHTLRKTIVLSIVFHLRNHLKSLYGATDQYVNHSRSLRERAEIFPQKIGQIHHGQEERSRR